MANEIRDRFKDTLEGQAILAIEQQARDGDPELLFALIQATGEVLRKHIADKGSHGSPDVV